MFNGPLARIYELLNNQYNQAKRSKNIDLKVSHKLVRICFDPTS
jgi:hypothetical protein